MNLPYNQLNKLIKNINKGNTNMKIKQGFYKLTSLININKNFPIPKY